MCTFFHVLCCNEHYFVKNDIIRETIGFQDGNKREEAECVLSKVKSWRDVGDTPYRKNHQEQAKLRLL
jgi:hypothetical protein